MQVSSLFDSDDVHTTMFRIVVKHNSTFTLANDILFVKPECQVRSPMIRDPVARVILLLEEQRRDLGYPASNIQLKLLPPLPLYNPPRDARRDAEAFAAALRRKRSSRELIVEVYTTMKKH